MTFEGLSCTAEPIKPYMAVVDGVNEVKLAFNCRKIFYPSKRKTRCNESRFLFIIGMIP
jgi:hypothetical protein